ncbi:MAG: DNA primase, partial [Desulfobacterales bacterium]
MSVFEQWEEVTARIKEQADIVQVIGEVVDLKKAGTRYMGLCPFHGEKTPSFSVQPGQQYFHCFGCGESGDVFSFIMKQQGISFADAVKLLAGKYQVELPEKKRSREEKERQEKRRQLFKINEKAAKLFSEYLLNARAAEPARLYLKKRGVTAAIIERFRIGYAPDKDVVGWNFLGGQFSETEKRTAIEAGLLVKKEQGGTYDRFRDRIVFPICSISGQVCGFGGRIVGEGQPKYLNSPESLVYNKSSMLLGLYQQKEQIRKQNQVILVEGNFDLISLVAYGFENVLAPLGTALTKGQLRLVKKFAEQAILLFDGDSAGIKAAVRAVPLFLAEQLAGKVALLPDSHDPDSFVSEYGVSALQRLLDEAEELPEFMLQQLIIEHGMGLDGKRKILDALAPLVDAAASPLQRSLFQAHFADKLGIPAEQFAGYENRKGMVPPLPGEPAEEYGEFPKIQVRERDTPEIDPCRLSMPQKQLVEYMVLHPADFGLLADRGLQEMLSGTIGEILFLELSKLLES